MSLLELKLKKTMIDILYILGTGSKFGNEELKYSLRSLETYVKDYGRVFITGVCPPFINKKSIIHTHEYDIGVPTVNHWWKVTQTIKKTDISDRFVLMYDDIFFVKTVELSNYPFYQKGLLTDKNGDSIYRRSVTKAAEWLIREECTYYDCELHIPCVYDRVKFMELEPIYEKMRLESIPEEKRGDIKLRSSTETVEGMIGDADCFSVSDWVYQCDTQRWLKEHFPNKSRWER